MLSTVKTADHSLVYRDRQEALTRGGFATNCLRPRPGDSHLPHFCNDGDDQRDERVGAQQPFQVLLRLPGAPSPPRRAPAARFPADAAARACAPQFEVSFECLAPLSEDIEWKLIYVGSAESDEHDQELDSILVGPMQARPSARSRHLDPSPLPRSAPRPDEAGCRGVTPDAFPPLQASSYKIVFQAREPAPDHGRFPSPHSPSLRRRTEAPAES